jgi:hypothetical protein
VEKQIRQLKQAKRLRRIGPAKGGNWQVLAWRSCWRKSAEGENKGLAHCKWPLYGVYST